MTRDEIAARWPRYVGPGTTHYEGCEHDHPTCAIRWLLAECERLARENERLRHEVTVAQFNK